MLKLLVILTVIQCLGNGENVFLQIGELSAARGAAAVRYMIEKGGIKAIRLIAAGYGDWTPKQLADYQSENPMYSPLKLTE